MSIDEFMQFALDVMKKTKSSMEEFKTRFVEVKKVWIENHKGHSKLFDEEEEEGDDEEEEGEEVTSAYTNVEDSIDYSQLFPSMYGEMTYAMLRLRYNIDYVKGAKAFVKMQQEEYVERLKQELQKKIRKKGEEASTKLLFPMILYLIIVMILVIYPAYQKLGGI